MRRLFTILFAFMLGACGGSPLPPRPVHIMPTVAPLQRRAEPARMWAAFSAKPSKLNLEARGGSLLTVNIPTEGTIDLAGKPLFVLPLRLANIEQGNARADCHYLAVLASLTLQRPELLGNMFWAVDAGHVSGNFYQPIFNGRGQLVALDKTVVTVERRSVPGGAAVGVDGSTWVANCERLLLAYMNQSNLVFDWTVADFGSPAYDFALLGFRTFGASNSFDPASFSLIATTLSNRGAATVITNKVTDGSVIGSHCYALTSVNMRARTVTLWNVWGFPFNGNPALSDGTITLSAAVAAANIHDVILSDGPMWTIPPGMSPTDPQRWGAPPPVLPVVP